VQTVEEARTAKYRQAAFAYLHVGLLYEAAVLAMWRAGVLPSERGHPLLWLGIGAIIVGAVFVGLYWWRNRWFARVIWAVHALRLPVVIEGAFFPDADARLEPAFYLTALVVIVINLWLLARAAWDL
jgi:hypothetical protein